MKRSAELSRYLVLWSRLEGQRIRRTRVALEPGYSTEADIPKMIAIPFDLPESSVNVLSVEKI